MHWTLVVTLCIVGLFAAAFLAGACMPSVLHGTVRFTVRNETQHAVFRRMTDFRRFHITGKMFQKRVDLRPVDGKPCWVENMGSSFVTAVLERSVEPLFAELHLKDSVVDMSAVWHLTVVDQPQHRDAARDVVVSLSQSITLKGYRPRACLFRLILALVSGATAGPKEYAKSILTSFDQPHDSIVAITKQHTSANFHVLGTMPDDSTAGKLS